jgi:hypothetical protein
MRVQEDTKRAVSTSPSLTAEQKPTLNLSTIPFSLSGSSFFFLVFFTNLLQYLLYTQRSRHFAILLR